MTAKQSPLEKSIERDIVDYLELLPECFAWKNHTIGVYDVKKKAFRRPPKHTLRGVSDILGIYKGKFLAIEVKRPTNKVRPAHQIEFIESVKIRGGVAFFASSVEEVEMELILSEDQTNG